MKGTRIAYGCSEANNDNISSNLSEADMDKFTYTAQNGCEVTLVYDSSVDDENIIKSIKSLMESMAIQQVRCTKEAGR